MLESGLRDNVWEQVQDMATENDKPPRPRAGKSEAEIAAATRPEDVVRPSRDPQGVREVLRQHGLRFSRPREAILGFLREEDRHVSAESLYLNLKQRGEDLSLSTVYLNLAALSAAGLVCEFRGANGESLYDSNVSAHYHVVCKETGEILDVPAPLVDGKPLGQFLKETVEAATGWQVDEPHFSLSGVSPKARRDD